ncbi:MAG TPA: methyltransferase domain-containing protein [Burkholderiales bacterium]|nr:methyltransferase domain-containing protein [Burkholderiales bacterium]
MSKADPESDAAAARLRRGPKLDPAGPDFWDLRFREGFMPWDAGGVPAALREFLTREPAGRRVLVPGCGSGYEVRAFADAGHEVVAIDFSAAAIEAAQRVLGELGRVLVQGDFFAHPLGEYDLVYERAFLCALPRPLWPRWAARVAEVMRPGGRLAGFFYWSDDGRGPPFGLKPGELEALLAPAFDRTEDAPAIDSIPVFAGRERWQIWRRR